MSSSTVAGSPDAPGFCSAPPPPPPPPVPSQVPAMRINTENPSTRRPQPSANDAYEPPAAIQNAMLTKDKKPFTYTPGMGGKLDLSQIRSPRMARRVAKNANDEGIEGPPKSASEPRPQGVSQTGNLFVQPQMAVPVFPANVPPPPPQPMVNRIPQSPLANRTPSNASERAPEAPKTVTRVEPKVTPISVTMPTPSSASATPESAPTTPPQVTLAKAPTPWLQNKNKPPEELPEWAKRPNKQHQNSQSPDSPSSPPAFVQIPQNQQQNQQPATTVPQWQQQQPQTPKQQLPQFRQQPASPQPQQFQQQQNVRSQPGYVTPTRQQQPQQQQQSKQQERVIPIRIEDRPSVFAAKQEAGHHQFKQPSTHHQQRWGQPNHPQSQPQQVPPPPQPQQQQGGYIIPIMVEGSEKRTPSGPSYTQANVRNNVAENTTPRANPPQRSSIPIQQHEGEPVQSRSFRVLQKITDTDSNDVDSEQMRKLQLTEDDRILMNKFKEQVDGDTYLHQEEDPRYRGAAIPSRAFRFLQNMTESGDVTSTSAGPRGPSAIRKQNRNSKSFEETQANLPPSEQQVPEPKKYMGSAIPSRSFRLLQAMTAPESVGPDATDY